MVVFVIVVKVISQSNTRGWEREEIVTLTVKAGATYNRSMPNGPNVVLIVVPCVSRISLLMSCPLTE